MRRAARTDANHAEIMGAFRDVGFVVHDTHRLGEGFPDLLIGKGRRIALVEVKDGRLPPSKRELTDDERDFHLYWPVLIVESVDDVLDIAREWILERGDDDQGKLQCRSR